MLELPGPDKSQNRLVVDLEAEPEVDVVVLRDGLVAAGVQGLRGLAVVE